jgi:hypothetical protein
VRARILPQTRADTAPSPVSVQCPAVTNLVRLISEPLQRNRNSPSAS